ncbi:uncharacterized protein LAJ45_07434 [Morchella importuna]|uniref:uncharacterized protein n=1 Tax=Morchella importuna TaxID=1174673 RepID=UPI001E8EAFB3|nr:uncharacterized protein LAJ45_07434 [Morchella importuna]KAH8148333.1 hypothetical protein LAJ45_07434 [Morchella importuna]
MYFRILQCPTARAPTPPHPYYYYRDTSSSSSSTRAPLELRGEVLEEEKAHMPYYEHQYNKERQRQQQQRGKERLRSGEAAVRRLGGRRWLVVGWEEDARWGA